MSVEKLNDDALLSSTLSLVKQERELTLEILKHIREIELRRLFAKLGYSSLHKYLVKELKYSDGQAYRRMQAARLIKSVPEVEPLLKLGQLNLQTACQVEKFAREEKLSPIKKRFVVEQAKDKRSKALEQNLLSLSGKDHTTEDRRKMVSANNTELKITLDSANLKKLDRVRDLVAAKGLNRDSELIVHLLDFYLKNKDPMILGQKSNNIATFHQRGEIVRNLKNIEADHSKNKVASLVQKSKHQRYVGANLKQQVWLRAKGACEFVGCGETYGLELDHIRPISLGGRSGLDNLRLLCKAHNQYVAIQNGCGQKIQRHL